MGRGGAGGSVAARCDTRIPPYFVRQRCAAEDMLHVVKVVQAKDVKASWPYDKGNDLDDGDSAFLLRRRVERWTNSHEEANSAEETSTKRQQDNPLPRLGYGILLCRPLTTCTGLARSILSIRVGNFRFQSFHFLYMRVQVER